MWLKEVRAELNAIFSGHIERCDEYLIKPDTVDIIGLLIIGGVRRV